MECKTTRRKVDEVLNPPTKEDKKEQNQDEKQLVKMFELH